MYSVSRPSPRPHGASICYQEFGRYNHSDRYNLNFFVFSYCSTIFAFFSVYYPIAQRDIFRSLFKTFNEILEFSVQI